jgi:hypothetical protein
LGAYLTEGVGVASDRHKTTILLGQKAGVSRYVHRFRAVAPVITRAGGFFWAQGLL